MDVFPQNNEMNNGDNENLELDPEVQSLIDKLSTVQSAKTLVPFFIYYYCYFFIIFIHCVVCFFNCCY